MISSLTPFLHTFRNKDAGVVSNEVPCSCEQVKASSNTPFFDMVASYLALCLILFGPRISEVSFDTQNLSWSRDTRETFGPIVESSIAHAYMYAILGNICRLGVILRPNMSLEHVITIHERMYPSTVTWPLHVVSVVTAQNRWQLFV